MNRIYLDNNATTKPDPLVVEAVKESLELCWGNPSSLHRRGQEARAVIDRARRSVARLIGAVSDSIVFTSGGTEANNLALFGVAMAGYGKKMHIITSAIEHQSVLNSCRALERLDFEVTYIPVDGGGRVDVQTVADAIRPDTAIISIMHANNDTGVMQPLRAISALARER
ncbi:MAG: aminotransferase class V-fold PLP-dependent enzyme, partial [Myxococcota bacterium]